MRSRAGVSRDIRIRGFVQLRFIVPTLHLLKGDYNLRPLFLSP